MPQTIIACLRPRKSATVPNVIPPMAAPRGTKAYTDRNTDTDHKIRIGKEPIIH